MIAQLHLQHVLHPDDAVFIVVFSGVVSGVVGGTLLVNVVLSDTSLTKLAAASAS